MKKDIEFKFNGYHIADRLLEGCLFRVVVEIDTRCNSVEVKDVSIPLNMTWDYIESLGAPGTADYWCKQVKTYCEGDIEEIIIEHCENDLPEHVLDFLVDRRDSDIIKI